MPASETPVRRRSALAATAVVILAFVAGIAAGIVGDRIYLVTHQRIIPRGGIEFMGRHLIRRLDRSLELTDAQEAQIEEIVERRTRRMLESSDAVHRAIRDEFAATHTEIEKVLTPEQREKYRRMQHRWHARGHRGR